MILRLSDRSMDRFRHIQVFIYFMFYLFFNEKIIRRGRMGLGLGDPPFTLHDHDDFFSGVAQKFHFFVFLYILFYF